MAMIGMSPWAAAAGGLAGGLGQGILTGVDLAQRRRQEEAQKQRDAMSLLITGFKHLSDDPDTLKQFTQWFGQTTGMPVPPWVGGTGGGVAGKLAQQRDQMKAAGFSDAQINAYLFSLKDKGETPHGVKWFNVPGQGYRAFSYGEQPPQGSTPLVVEPPWVQPMRETPGGGLEPTEGGPVQRGAPIIRQKGGRSEFVTNTKTGEVTLKEIKPGEKLGPDETFASKRDVDADIEKTALARIKGSVDYKLGSPEEQASMLEKAKDAVRKEKMPWTKTGTSPPAGYERFKAAYAKNPQAAIAASKKAGDGFAERLQRESLPGAM